MLLVCVYLFAVLLLRPTKQANFFIYIDSNPSTHCLAMLNFLVTCNRCATFPDSFPWNRTNKRFIAHSLWSVFASYAIKINLIYLFIIVSSDWNVFRQCVWQKRFLTHRTLGQQTSVSRPTKVLFHFYVIYSIFSSRVDLLYVYQIIFTRKCVFFVLLRVVSRIFWFFISFILTNLTAPLNVYTLYRFFHRSFRLVRLTFETSWIEMVGEGVRVGNKQ